MEDQGYRHEMIVTTRDLDVVFLVRRDKGSFVTKHWHDTIEMIYIFRGSTYVMADSWEKEVRAGELMVINAGVVHSTRNMYGNDCILLQIPLDIPGRFVKDIKSVNFDVPLASEDAHVQECLEHMKAVLRQMKRVMDSKDDGYALKFESLLYDLLYTMYVNFGRRSQAGPATATVREEEARMTKVVDYTKAHYRETISLGEISGVIHLQPEYFCRYFKKCMGMTYLEYLNELRLSYIYEDLINTDWPLYQILQNHGFKNYKLFRRLFNSRFGCTPGKLREMSRKVSSGEDGCMDEGKSLNKEE